MKQIRKRLTYANVMSTIAVFLVIGGASAFAATQLAKNSVGSKQLKKNAVTTAKIKNNAVTAGKIANEAVTNGKLAAGSVTTDKIADGAVTNSKLGANSVTGDKVQDGSLNGSDINQGSLNGVKASNVYATSFREVGGIAVINPSDPGIKSGGCFLVCAVEFPRNVTNCTATVSATDTGPGGTGEPAIGEVFHSSNDNEFLVAMFNDEGTLIAHDFSIVVVCPTAT